jgi:hypothetical protein|tara:strand:+ start:12185 stop:12448 length:264 start_codon:yes stop_codon:yes gene_type:complete
VLWGITAISHDVLRARNFYCGLESFFRQGWNSCFPIYGAQNIGLGRYFLAQSQYTRKHGFTQWTGSNLLLPWAARFYGCPVTEDQTI